MRKELSVNIEELMQQNENVVFITGDLGFDAFENIKVKHSTRFINAGVAEQNMIGVAAGIAYKGFKVFTYSIAPFAVYRCLEQIKLDVCIHNQPVCIIGNGGGYGYGIMGATHHAIEDIACLSVLPNMNCWIPAFKEDLEYCINKIIEEAKPSYLRLGLGKNSPYSFVKGDINCIKKASNTNVTVIALGPIVHNVIDAISDIDGVDLFTILRIPALSLTKELLQSVSSSGKVLVVEEHMERGGLGEHILSALFKSGIYNFKYLSIHAQGYPNGLYGSQAYHQEQSGLDTKNIREQILNLL